MSTRRTHPFRFCLEWPSGLQDQYYAETVAWEQRGMRTEHDILERICMAYFADPGDEEYGGEYMEDNWGYLQEELADYAT